MRPIFGRLVCAFIVCVLSAPALRGQAPQPSTATVPRVIRVTGALRLAAGTPAPVEIVTFAIYAAETGGEPLWQETQNVTVTADGQYTSLLGSTSPDGLPLDVFTSKDSRWLGVQVNRVGEREQARTLLTSVPYALRASDAETLGGRPASAYLLAEPNGASGTASSTASSHGTEAATRVASATTNTFGSVNSLGKFVTPFDLTTSSVWDAGGQVGINTASPFDALHVRFFDPSGIFTGYAVQNLGSGASAYSGMLFYDQNGAVGQFQGFNNGTHEYRINNVARTLGVADGSINFMINSAPKFKINSNGRIDVGSNIATLSAASTGSRGQAAGWQPGPNGGPGVVLEGSSGGEGGGFYADGDVAVIWSPGDPDLLRVVDEDFLPNPFAPGAGRFIVDGVGNISLGSNGLGCVKDSDGSIIAGFCASDERLKKDIRPFDGGMLARALTLRPVYYHWRQDMMKGAADNSGEAYGFIAQEVEKVYPEMVGTDANGYKAVDYGKLQYVLLGAFQEEHAKVTALTAKVDSLEQRLARLEAANTSVASRLVSSAPLTLIGLATLGFAFYRRT